MKKNRVVYRMVRPANEVNKGDSKIMANELQELQQELAELRRKIEAAKNVE
jgi:HAMP domain-containing protein